MLKDYFLFLQNPSFPSYNLQIKRIPPNILTVIKTYLITLGFVLIAAIISVLCDRFLVSFFLGKSLITSGKNFNILYQKFGHLKFFYVVLFVPAIEELIIRLPLKVKTSFIAFSFSMLVFPLVGFNYTNFDFHSLHYFFGVLIILIFLPICLNWVFKKINIINFINRNYKFYFYLLATLFALAHISNFKPINYHYFFVYPIFVLPQFVMGVSLGYVRNKCGLPYSLLLHALINLPHGF